MLRLTSPQQISFMAQQRRDLARAQADSLRAAAMADAMEDLYIATGAVTEADLTARGFSDADRARLAPMAIAILRTKVRKMERAA